jgi:Zn finger protein HypA/HybF involved in hydrogenase expression
MAEFTTNQKAKLVRELIAGIVEAVQSGGKHGVPESSVYLPLANVMSVQIFTQFVETMIAERLVERRNHVLYYTGPMTKCEHQWEEQPGEPPFDACPKCGARRE